MIKLLKNYFQKSLAIITFFEKNFGGSSLSADAIDVIIQLRFGGPLQSL